MSALFNIFLMKNEVIKRITFIFFMLCIIMLQFGCAVISEDNSDVQFDCEIITKDLALFTIDIPTNWSIAKDDGIEDVAAGEICMEALSEFDDSGNCSRVEVIKGETVSKKSIKKIIKGKDIDAILTRLQQAYGTDIVLDNSDFYKIGGKDCFNYEVLFVKNGNEYVLSQTYFVVDKNIYSVSVVVINENDINNALNIPFSIKFAE